MSKEEHGYVEHQTFEVEGFRVSDATATGLRPHDDLVWVGYGGTEGRWLSPESALELARGIVTVVNSNLARRNFATALGGDHLPDQTDSDANALIWIADTIATDKANGCYGYVEEEVVAEFNKYRSNNPNASPMDHAKSAMHACAHQ